MAELRLGARRQRFLREVAEDAIRQRKAEALGDRPATAEQRKRASRGPRIDGHVKPALVPLKPKAIDKMRCYDGWPPDLALVDVLLVSLLAGSEDLTQWSDDVSRAVTVWRAAQAEDRKQLRAHPHAKEQLAARSQVLQERRIHQSVRRRKGEAIDDSEYDRETFELTAKEMRYVARRQQWLVLADQQDGPRRRGRRSIPKLLSVIDGWRWRGGRPRECDVPTLLLRVEIWRDVRAQVRPGDGPVSRAEALVEVLVHNLRRHPETWKQVDRWRRYYEEEECLSSPRALASAVGKVNGKHVRSLEASFSEALNRWTPKIVGPCPIV